MNCERVNPKLEIFFDLLLPVTALCVILYSVGSVVVFVGSTVQISRKFNASCESRVLAKHSERWQLLASAHKSLPALTIHNPLAYQQPSSVIITVCQQFVMLLSCGPGTAS